MLVWRAGGGESISGSVRNAAPATRRSRAGWTVIGGGTPGKSSQRPSQASTPEQEAVPSAAREKVTYGYAGLILPQKTLNKPR